MGTRNLVRLVFLIAAVLAATTALADERSEKLLEEGKRAFDQRKWLIALEKLELAKEYGIEGEAAGELSLYLGGLYAQKGEKEAAASNFRKIIHERPEFELPGSFTRTMSALFAETRREFPLVKIVSIPRTAIRPYREKFEIRFTVSANEDTLNRTTLSFCVTDSTGKTVLAESEVVMNPQKEMQTARWDGRDRANEFLAKGGYRLRITATRDDSWKHSAEMEVVCGGNFDTEKAKNLMEKSRRASLLTGKQDVQSAPDLRDLRVSKEPMMGSCAGAWNLVYYIFIGSVRDAVDFPVKYLCSQPVVGHALTVAGPVSAGYMLGKTVYDVDKADYYDPVAGFDEDTYEKDKDASKLNSAGFAVLAPVWVFAYAGVMSVVSWAGTEDGIAGGFNSYFDSNVFADGYDYKYFFPNYRSLNFSDLRVDDEALAEMNSRIESRRREIQSKVVRYNEAGRTFNMEKMRPFRNRVREAYNSELYDYIELEMKSATKKEKP